MVSSSLVKGIHIPVVSGLMMMIRVICRCLAELVSYFTKLVEQPLAPRIGSLNESVAVEATLLSASCVCVSLTFLIPRALVTRELVKNSTSKMYREPLVYYKIRSSPTTSTYK